MAVATKQRAVFGMTEIRSVVSQLAPLCRPNSTRPIMRCIRLKAEGGECIAQATDTEVSAAIRFECEGDLDLVVPADFLSRVVGFIDADLEIKCDDNSAEFICRRSRWKTPTENPDEFPAIEIRAEGAASVPSAWLATAIRGTMHTADKNANANYCLGGVCFDFRESFALVATDGKGMCACDLGKTLEHEQLSGVVPLAACKSILRCLPDEGDAQVLLSTNNVTVVAGGTSLVCRLLEGRFPQWRKGMKSEGSDPISIPSQSLRVALERVAFLTDDKSRGVELQSRDGSLRLSANTPKGKSDTEIPIAGDIATCTIDPDYLMAFLRDSAGESITASTHEEKRCLFESNGFQFVLVPLARK